ncbi:MAG: SPFH domain-containing protein, partial [bacterium]
KKQKQKAPAGEKKESWWKRWRKERKEEKEEKRNGFAASSAVWIIFFVVAASSSVTISIIIGDLSKIQILIPIISIFLTLIVFAISIHAGWCQVPEEERWVIKVLGAYGGTWEPGLHIIFPWFGIMKLKSVDIREKRFSLFRGDLKNKVEFKNGSSAVIGAFFFIIKDPYLAIFGPEDFEGSLREIVDSAMRTFLGQLSLDEAKEFSPQVNLPMVLLKEKIEREDEGKGNLIWPTEEKLNYTKKDLEKIRLWRDMKNDWGVELVRVSIKDIPLDQDIVDAMNEIIKAEKDAEKAVHLKQKTITMAEADAQATKLKLDAEGSGLGKKIKNIAKENGVSAEFIINYLNTQKLFDNIGDKTVIMGSGSSNGIIEAATQFAVGYQSYQQKKEGAGQETKNKSETVEEGEK